jgi:hypothetical protein
VNGVCAGRTDRLFASRIHIRELVRAKHENGSLGFDAPRKSKAMQEQGRDAPRKSKAVMRRARARPCKSKAKRLIFGSGVCECVAPCHATVCGLMRHTFAFVS